MSWTVLWSRPALRDLRRLDRQTADRVRAAVDRYRATEQGDVRRLHGVPRPTWRLRLGDVRVLFVFDAGLQTLTVHRVAPRGRAYRDL